MNFTQRASKQRRSHDAGADGCGVGVGREGLVLSCGQQISGWNFKDSFANELKALGRVGGHGMGEALFFKITRLHPCAWKKVAFGALR